MGRISAPIAFATRVVNVWKIEGPRGLCDRISRRVATRYARLDLDVISFEARPGSADGGSIPNLDSEIARNLERTDRLFGRLQFRRLAATDGPELDELTRIDPWQIPKPVTLQNLAEGWTCYVAIHDTTLVASWWTKVGGGFFDTVLKQFFSLGNTEAYHGRAFCVPEYRNRAVVPRLAAHVIGDLAHRENVRSHLGFVRRDNHAQRRTLQHLGWAVVGRVGFVEAMGIRLNYVRGKNVLSETKARVSVRLGSKPRR